jgi:hypothetical protein
MAASSSPSRALSESGSKVITDPGELGPDLLQALLDGLGRLGHELDGNGDERFTWYVSRSVRTVLALTALLLAGCAGSASDGRARVSGLVTIGPTPGPCVAGTPCWRPAGGVELVFSRPAHEPGRATTDKRGHYELDLEPGTYRVRAPKYAAPAVLHPATVTVERDMRLNIAIDSGVR